MSGKPRLTVCTPETPTYRLLVRKPSGRRWYRADNAVHVDYDSLMDAVDGMRSAYPSFEWGIGSTTEKWGKLPDSIGAKIGR